MAWITGAEILEREGWGGLRLRQAFDKGELCPYRTHDEARFTAESKCFRCVHAQESYCAIDCLKPGQGRVIDTIVNLRKQGVPQVRGAVDKDAFRDGFPTTLFDHPIARNDSEFLQFIEDKIGPENLRAMLAETLCHREADDDEKNPAAMLNRLRRTRYKLNEVEAYECLHGIGTSKASETGAIEPDPRQQAITPEEVVALSIAEGIKDPRKIARKLDDTFTGETALSHLELGRLLPADHGITISSSSQRDRGKRLRGLKK